MSIIAISNPLALPTSPVPTDTEINLDYLVGFDASKFSGAGQAQDWGGRLWRARVTLPPMTRAQANLWLAFFSLCRGQANWFLMGDWDRRTPSGTIAGTVLVNGASQTGNGLAVDGATAGTTLLRGDLIQVENRLYRNVADLTFDGGGAGVIQIEPSLRTSPADNAAVTYTSPKGLFRMAQNYLPSPSDFNGIHRFSFAAFEKL